MTTDQIRRTFDTMLATPKSKTFLNHLVRSYLPVTNTKKVFTKPEGEFKCTIGGEKLISIEEILNGLETEEFKADFNTHLKNMFDTSSDVPHPMNKITGGRTLGLTGKDTTTFMSYQTFQIFYDWVITKALKGDKHINWLLSSVNRNSFMKRAEGISDGDVQKKLAGLKKFSKPKVATNSLGDFGDVLQNLKKDLQAKGQ